MEKEANNADALINKGVALGNLGKYEEAIAEYDKALELKPDHADALINKGVALGRLGQYQEAIQWIDKALEIKPNNAAALNNKGVALERLGRLGEAVVCFYETLNIDLNSTSAYESAIRCLDKILDNWPTSPTGWSEKAYLLSYYGKKNKEALHLVEKALEIDPNHREALQTKADILYNLKKYDEAILFYNKIIEELSPNDAHSLYNRACCNIITGNIDKGLDDLKRALDNDDEQGFFTKSAREDEDLKSIRNDERFKALIAE